MDRTPLYAPDGTIVTHGLIVHPHWASLISTGYKTLELRRKRTRRRGWIGIVAQGTGTVIAVSQLVDVHGPLAPADLPALASWHGLTSHRLNELLKRDQPIFAWQLAETRHLAIPHLYHHRHGAVVWVRLADNNH